MRFLHTELSFERTASKALMSKSRIYNVRSARNEIVMVLRFPGALSMANGAIVVIRSSRGNRYFPVVSLPLSSSTR